MDMETHLFVETQIGKNSYYWNVTTESTNISSCFKKRVVLHKIDRKQQ